MPRTWNDFFTPKGLEFLRKNIDLALAEDGCERTSEGIFSADDELTASVRAKEKTFVVGLPVIDLVFQQMQTAHRTTLLVPEGSTVAPYTSVATITAPATALLKAERVILNYICHLSGIANLTAAYAEQLAGTPVRLLDTRKTTPGLRWPEKYAIQIGGGQNHRMDLESMLMLKDNHIDATGSIRKAVEMLRTRYVPCPPVEVECRTRSDVEEAVDVQADRIMLDNMSVAGLTECLPCIPGNIEAEISGGVTLETIRTLASIGPRHADFISVGRLTHSARAADFSMTIAR